MSDGNISNQWSVLACCEKYTGELKVMRNEELFLPPSIWMNNNDESGTYL